MSTRGDRKTIRNGVLVLKVTSNMNASIWELTRYEAFLDELCPSNTIEAGLLT